MMFDTRHVSHDYFRVRDPSPESLLNFGCFSEKLLPDGAIFEINKLKNSLINSVAFFNSDFKRELKSEFIAVPHISSVRFALLYRHG